MSKIDKSAIESLETFKDLFDHAHDLIHIVDPEGTILYVNKAWETILEYTQDDVQGRSIYSLVCSEDRELFATYRQDLMRGIVTDKQVTVRFSSKSGKVIALEGFVSVRWQNGQAVYTRGIFRDISLWLQKEHELEVANETLKEKESNLQQLLTHAPDAIVVINYDSIITYWNPKAAALFGWTAEEALGKNLSDTIIPPQYREAHNRGMNRYLNTGEAHVLNKTIQLTALHKDGSEFYISLTISTTRQNDKPAFIAFIRNIQREKSNEMELEKKRRELEQSNEELEQFAHAASHDMKEPVRKIKLFVDQLKLETGGQLSASATRFLDKIDNSASRLINMIDGVLAHSSVNATEASREVVDLNGIVAQVVSDLEMVIQRENAMIQVGELPEVEGVPFLLYQLFYNLVSNALKFIRPGIPPLVRIAAQKTTFSKDNKSYIEIIISDNGIGFPDKDSEKIFKKFSRLHSNTKYEGTGLGLALCKSIVEKHNGIIQASPGKNNGAVFRILLPSRSEVDA